MGKKLGLYGNHVDYLSHHGVRKGTGAGEEASALQNCHENDLMGKGLDIKWDNWGRAC